MINVLILGAAGEIARVATRLFLEQTDIRLTLYLRKARRLKSADASDRIRVIEGDVLDAKTLCDAMQNQDVVYANLSGNLESQARSVIAAMQKAGVKRLIWISSMGIYGEVSGEHFGTVLDPYRASAQIIERSDLDYTLIRPAWLNNQDEIDYGTTRKGEMFKNPSAVVSRKSVADLVVKLTTTPDLEVRGSLGVHKAS